MTPEGLQPPCPSHVPAVLRRVAAHVGRMQTVSGAYFAQAPKPSEVPVSPHLIGPLSTQTWRGSALPRSIGQHVPRRPVWLHDTQGPWHATAQQTPSVQKPEAQSWFFEQLVPLDLGPQLPLTHCTPTAQSIFDEQTPKHFSLLASHEYGAQTSTLVPLHTPRPSQICI